MHWGRSRRIADPMGGRAMTRSPARVLPEDLHLHLKLAWPGEYAMSLSHGTRRHTRGQP